MVVTPPVRCGPDQADDRVNRLQPSLTPDRHKQSSMRVRREEEGRYQGSNCLLDIPIS